MRSDQIALLLSAAYQRAATPGSVLSALLDAMEEPHAPSEAVLAAGDTLAAPYQAPAPLLPFLTRWVALDHLGIADAVPACRLRDLIACGAYLARWRGTATGLRALLETTTGVTGFTIEEDADRLFHIVVRVPAEAAGHMDLLRRLVALEKPAATTCELVVEPADPGGEVAS
jgi:phage tail-like protein